VFSSKYRTKRPLNYVCRLAAITSWRFAVDCVITVTCCETLKRLRCVNVFSAVCCHLQTRRWCHSCGHFWATVTSNGSPYDTGPMSRLFCLSCLSVMLVYCGQTVGWIKMPLGTEVGLGAGDIVLDGDPPLPRKGAQQPAAARLYGACLLWPNGRPSQQLLSSC